MSPGQLYLRALMYLSSNLVYPIVGIPYPPRFELETSMYIWKEIIGENIKSLICFRFRVRISTRRTRKQRHTVTLEASGSAIVCCSV
ncbi:hypothetical protein SUGI_0128790 [Cryptomeria japonica]|nr:hypothetical protein SUGI_0128790 [Cryptomeria japonica]